MHRRRLIPLLVTLFALAAVPNAQNQNQSGPSASPAASRVPDDTRAERMKAEALKDVDGMQVFTQQMVDSIFSFAELGFQETETHRYLVDVLKKNGFTVQEGIAGIPTAFMATWGSGKPVIALGSDIDGIPQASQKPGVA
jgi:aminobenzoyl-glutamate utilization protein B